VLPALEQGSTRQHGFAQIPKVDAPAEGVIEALVRLQGPSQRAVRLMSDGEDGASRAIVADRLGLARATLAWPVWAQSRWEQRRRRRR
jgi:hypothetical protein